MKICKKCNKEKTNEEFGKDKNKTDGLQLYCKVCKREIDINSLNNDPNRRLKQTQRNKEYRKWFDELKNDYSCEKCGDNRSYVLDFHHKDPKIKEFSISIFQKTGKRREQVLKELKKCIPLCRNCHSEFHYLEREKGITIKQYLI